MARRSTFSATASMQLFKVCCLFKLSLINQDTNDDGHPAADLMLSMSYIVKTKMT